MTNINPDKLWAKACYGDHPLVKFLVKHDACPFAYTFFMQHRPDTMERAWEVGDIRVCIFMYHHGMRDTRAPYFDFSERLVQFLYEQGETKVGEQLQLRITHARELAENMARWNDKLIDNITLEERAAAHRKTVEGLAVSIARRITFYAIDIVQQTLAGTYDERLAYYLADFFRDAIGFNPFNPFAADGTSVAKDKA